MMIRCLKTRQNPSHRIPIKLGTKGSNHASNSFYRTVNSPNRWIVAESSSYPWDDRANRTPQHAMISFSWSERLPTIGSKAKCHRNHSPGRCPATTKPCNLHRQGINVDHVKRLPGPREYIIWWVYGKFQESRGTTIPHVKLNVHVALPGR